MYRFMSDSTEDLTTGNVIARCFLDVQKARTVFKAFAIQLLITLVFKPTCRFDQP